MSDSTFSAVPMAADDRDAREALPRPLHRLREDRKVAMICREVFDGICVLANGEIVCSCNDPAAQQVYGNVLVDRIADVFNGRAYKQMRRWMLESPPGHWCPALHASCPARATYASASDRADERHVKLLQLEPVSHCNLRCPECPVTHFSTTPVYRGNRGRQRLELDVMIDIIDQLEDLETILFYNYGEPFLHKDAVVFLREVRRRRPRVEIGTNTNGLMLKPADIEAIATEALLDTALFSIDGVENASYRKYRVGGDASKALANLEALCRAAETCGTRDRMRIIWQYILFEWNDSDEELARAKDLAQQIRVPIQWTLTGSQGASKRFLPGSAEFAGLIGADRSYNPLTSGLRLSHMSNENDVKARCTARLSTTRQVLNASLGSRIALSVDIESLAGEPWIKERAGRFRVGVLLRTREGRRIQELQGACLPPEFLSGGEHCRVAIEVTAPEQPGEYQLLIDLVEEGVCWFFERGSEPLLCPLFVEKAKAA